MQTRPAELAGRWYPARPEDCDALLEPVDEPAGLPAKAFAAIAPHAGWVFSGKVAHQALEAVRARSPDADLVVIFGGHLASRDLPRVFLEGAWETPYGPLEIETDVASDVAMVVENDAETPERYFDDNAVEVLAPMVKKLWPRAKAVIVGVPPTKDASKIGAEVVDRARVRGYEKIVAVGSTDLTHYGPNYAFTPHGRGQRSLDWVKNENDPLIVHEMEAMDAGKVIWVAQRNRNACCPGAAAAAIAAARKLGATRGVTTQYTTSHDVKPLDPEPSSFVGYVGMVLGAD